MKKLFPLFVLFAWTFIVPLSEADEPGEWTDIKSENGRSAFRIEKMEHNPQIVRFSTQAYVGESFLTFVRSADGADSRIFIYYEYSFMGVSAGSVVLKLRTYGVIVSSQDWQQKQFLNRLQTFEESKELDEQYVGQVIMVAPAISKKDDVTENTLFIPLKQSEASFVTPPLQLRGAGIVNVSLATDTSLFKIAFRTFDEVYPQPKGPSAKSR